MALIYFGLNWEWLIALFLTPLFWFPGWWTWFALGFFILLKIGRWRIQGRFWHFNFFDLAVALLFLSALIGYGVALDSRLSLNRLGSLLAGIVIYTSVRASLTAPKIQKGGAFGLTLLGIGVAVGSLLGTDWGRGDLIKIPFIYDNLPHLFGNVFGSGVSAEQEINPRVVAGTLVLLVPFAWVLALSHQLTKLQRGLAIPVALFLTFVLLLTQAPTAIGGILLAVILYGLISKIPPKFLALVLAGFSSLIGLAVWFGGGGLLGLLSSSTEPGVRIVFRLEMWLRAFDMLGDRPFTGIGLNNFPLILEKYYPTYSLGAESHAHNLFLQTALDGGILGLAALFLLLFFLASAVKTAWKFNPTARPLIGAGAIATLAWLFYGVAESITLAHKPALFLWLIWGMLLNLAYPRNPILLQPRFLVVKPKLILSGVIFTAVALGLIFGWHKLNQNLAIIETQNALKSNQVGAISQASATWQTFNNPVMPSAATLELQARLAIAKGDYAQATTDLTRVVELDQDNPTAKYIPAEWNIWKKEPNLLPAPQARLYRQWQVRYPTDPFAYARLAVYHFKTCQTSKGQLNLEEGISATASPYLKHLLANKAALTSRC
jgi:O-antigen ligase